MEEAFEVRKTGRLDEVTETVQIEAGKKVKLVVERLVCWGKVDTLDDPR